VKKYRRKSEIVEAIRWTGQNLHEINVWMNMPMLFDCFEDGAESELMLHTPAGETHVVPIGDYIIRGEEGEYHVYKPEIFETTYEEVKEA
jgi:hypothetical protein